MQKRDKWREGCLVRPMPGHSFTPGPVSALSTLPRAFSLVWDPLPTQGNHCSASGLTMLLTPEAFQVARDLLFFPVPPAPMGHPPALASRSRREQGASGAFPAPPRGKPHLIPASRSLAQHWFPERKQHMEAEVGTAPLWLVREESSSESEGEPYVLPKAHHRYPAYAPLSFSASPPAGT